MEKLDENWQPIGEAIKRMAEKMEKERQSDKPKPPSPTEAERAA